MDKDVVIKDIEYILGEKLGSLEKNFDAPFSSGSGDGQSVCSCNALDFHKLRIWKYKTRMNLHLTEKSWDPFDFETDDSIYRCSLQNESYPDIYEERNKINNAYYDDLKTVGYGRKESQRYPRYNNSFDPRITFQGVGDCVFPYNVSDQQTKTKAELIENVFLALENPSQIMNDYLYGYREYLRNLSTTSGIHLGKGDQSDVPINDDGSDDCRRLFQRIRSNSIKSIFSGNNDVSAYDTKDNSHFKGNGTDVDGREKNYRDTYTSRYNIEYNGNEDVCVINEKVDINGNKAGTNIALSDLFSSKKQLNEKRDRDDINTERKKRVGDACAVSSKMSAQKERVEKDGLRRNLCERYAGSKQDKDVQSASELTVQNSTCTKWNTHCWNETDVSHVVDATNTIKDYNESIPKDGLEHITVDGERSPERVQRESVKDTHEELSLRTCDRLKANRQQASNRNNTSWAERLFNTSIKEKKRTASKKSGNWANYEDVHTHHSSTDGDKSVISTQQSDPSSMSNYKQASESEKYDNRKHDSVKFSVVARRTAVSTPPSDSLKDNISETIKCDQKTETVNSKEKIPCHTTEITKYQSASECLTTPTDPIDKEVLSSQDLYDPVTTVTSQLKPTSEPFIPPCSLSSTYFAGLNQTHPVNSPPVGLNVSDHFHNKDSVVWNAVAQGVQNFPSNFMQQQPPTTLQVPPPAANWNNYQQPPQTFQPRSMRDNYTHTNWLNTDTKNTVQTTDFPALQYQTSTHMNHLIQPPGFSYGNGTNTFNNRVGYPPVENNAFTQNHQYQYSGNQNLNVLGNLFSQVRSNISPQLTSNYNATRFYNTNNQNNFHQSWLGFRPQFPYNSNNNNDNSYCVKADDSGSVPHIKYHNYPCNDVTNETAKLKTNKPRPIRSNLIQIQTTDD